MEGLKELRYVDPASITIMSTAISVVFAIIIAIISTIALFAFGQGMIALYIIPTLIFGTIVLGISINFINAYLYNFLAKRINCIKLNINSDGEITKIAPFNTALILSLVSFIVLIVFYFASCLLISGIFSTIIQIFLYSNVPAMMSAGYYLYYLFVIYANLSPLYTLLILIGIFIITLVYYLIMFFVYNLLATKIGGAKIKLNTSNGISTLESIDVKSTALIYGAVSLIMGLIIGIIQALTGNYLAIISSAIGGLIGGLIAMAVIAILYNLLGEKLDKIKMELI